MLRSCAFFIKPFFLLLKTWLRALSGLLPLSIVSDQYKAMHPTFNCRSIHKYGILQDVDTGRGYEKASRMFEDQYWRKLFIKMPDDRKRF
ncbi:hypothetical protein RHSIM_Rhsim02G0017400 [Rhododendron simsii]|uniref:Uncharacterized protein n=1 Tax=Rhododendron simsii TaxID=118357 RepID=A0A834LV36_RHOSS|nr:hypothetical protein RHSIM_Rhsim02G0017400 [Rhododendron simsii]